MGTILFIFLILNFIGFLCSILRTRLKDKAQNKMDILLGILSVCGGSPGILLGILIFDQEASKENMMIRVFVICVLIIQIVILLARHFLNGQELRFDIWNFILAHETFFYYLLAVNIATFAAFGIDKWSAIHGRRRIRIVTLLGFSFVGGSVGALIGMYLFRHKTQKNYFKIGVPLILIMQLAVLFLVMNLF